MSLGLFKKCYQETNDLKIKYMLKQDLALNYHQGLINQINKHNLSLSPSLSLPLSLSLSISLSIYHKSTHKHVYTCIWTYKSTP